MGADIENPDPDGCVVATAEPSRHTFKGRLSSLLRNPNGAGAGAGDDDHHHKEAAKPPNGGTVVAQATAAAEKPKTLECQCGWRNCVLYACSAVSFVVIVASVHLQKNDEAHGIKNTQHTVLACVGYAGGVVLMLSFLFAAMSVGAEIR